MKYLTDMEKIKVFGLYAESQFVETIGRGGRGTGPSQYVIHKLMEHENIDGYKLLLKPLELLTEKELKEVTFLLKEIFLDAKTIIAFFKDREEINYIPWPAYQFLISKGYAVPLFFGLNHPMNGKNAIELGIAIAEQ